MTAVHRRAQARRRAYAAGFCVWCRLARRVPDRSCCEACLERARQCAAAKYVPRRPEVLTFTIWAHAQEMPCFTRRGS